MRKIKFTNRNIIIAYALVVLLTLGTWTIIANLNEPEDSSNNPTAEEMTNEQLDNLLIAGGYTEEQLKELDLVEKVEAVQSDADYRYSQATTKLYSPAFSASEFPKSHSMETYKQLVALFAVGNYQAVSDNVNSHLSVFNFTTGNNLNIADVLRDASVMVHYERMDWSEKESALKLLQNPEAFVISVINAYPRRREAVIFDTNSLSPMTIGAISILKTTSLEKTSKEYMDNASYMEDVRAVYRIDFSYGEFDALTAYVLETNGKVLRMSGIYAEKTYEFMRTVSWWISMGKDREKGV